VRRQSRAAAQDPAARLATALALHQQGRLDQAAALYREILQSHPQHFDALQLLAMTEAQKGNAAAALALFEQALTINPHHAGALNNRGNVLRALKRPGEALASYDQALKAEPGHVEALSNRGDALLELERPAEALEAYGRALAIQPNHVGALIGQGSVLGELKRHEQALERFDKALRIQPNSAEALSNRGLALYNLKRYAEALESCDHALRIKTDLVQAFSHRGNALRALQRPLEALESYDRALMINQDCAEALSDRGIALQGLNRFAEARDSYARALLLKPDHAETHWNESLCRLVMGDFAAGWQKYEWRSKRELGLTVGKPFHQPLWLGQKPLEGKTILLHAEQGFGDTIQFCRYAKEVAALGAKVVLEVPPPLKALLQDLEGVSLLLARGERLPDFDYHCPLLSLPLAFRADLSNISGAAYLHSSPGKRQYWQNRLGSAGKKRIGLAWSGAAGHQNDRNRSLSLEEIAPLIGKPAEYYCLQKELRAADQAALSGMPDVQFMGDSLKDFSDTAAAVSLMDLVITVDTSVAHLAGAMGKEVWVLLPFSPDWRWLLDRNDSPWYASARLFRQPALGDWASVMKQVQVELSARFPSTEDVAGRQTLPLHKRPRAAVQDSAAKLAKALALHQQGRLDEAATLYQEILQAQPQHFEALQLLATIALQQRSPEAAVALFDQALKINPDHPTALHNYGVALRDLRRLEEALESYDRALKIQPDYAEALNSRGNALQDLKRFEEALASYDGALKIQPGYTEALNNRGNALRALKRLADALASYDRALQIRPDYAEALSNRGNVLRALKRPAEALESYDYAIRIKPDYVDAHLNEGLCRLLVGDFFMGWQKHEWRWKREPGSSSLRNFAQPLWLGKEALEGKTILLHAEQGFGDTIQFCRYAKEVAALGAKVVLEVPLPLKALLQDLEGVSLLLARGERLPDFDYHCPLLSLPLAFRADLSNISGAAYLHSSPGKRQYWQNRLGSAGKKRIGLAWSGAAGHQNDRNRSLSLEEIAPLIGKPAEYYCLQKELRAADQAALSGMPDVQFMGDSLKDFSDTAAAVSLMDLVITVDTSVAHLAGAMGKEVWILLPFSPDWRWLLDRNDSPWYSSARLFRQPALGDWASVMEQVRAALTARLASSEDLAERKGVSVNKQSGAAVHDPAARLETALALHQQGQLDQAAMLYQEIVQSQPQHFEALQLLATIALQQGRPEAAVALFDQALAINPRHPSALNNRGNALRDLKRPAEALESYDRALKLKPDYAQALSNRGAALRDLNRPAEALESCDRALAIKPGFADALSNRVAALQDLKRLEEEPDAAHALAARLAKALALHQQGRLDQAAVLYQEILQSQPQHFEALQLLATIALQQGRPEAAVALFDQALAINPRHPSALNNRGNALRDLKRPAEALESYYHALKIKPDYVEALSGRGNALHDLKRYEEALASYEHALNLQPGYAEALNNRGNTLQDLKRPDEALKSFERALRTRPDYAEAHWNEGLCRLLMGDFAEGWPKYEWRWKREPGSSALRNFTQALWLGKEKLEGKTILLHAEQGLGDTIQFCRYARQVAALGARVVLEVQPPLKVLLQDLEGASLVLGRGERLPDFDFHCPLMSLPLALQVDMASIAGGSYLHSDPKKLAEWQARLGNTRQKKVGLVWSGSAGHPHDHSRSLALEDIRVLVAGQASYYCLQKEWRPAEPPALVRASGIEVLGGSLKDFSDTAAVVALMDVVITVDTSVAHLAGAMGKEVWILLPFSPDWRWLLDRNDSPWYASARLFRQPALGDWADVLMQVQAALTARFQ